MLLKCGLKNGKCICAPGGKKHSDQTFIYFKQTISWCHFWIWNQQTQNHLALINLHEAQSVLSVTQCTTAHCNLQLLFLMLLHVPLVTAVQVQVKYVESQILWWRDLPCISNSGVGQWKISQWTLMREVEKKKSVWLLKSFQVKRNMIFSFPVIVYCMVAVIIALTYAFLWWMQNRWFTILI